MKELAFPNTEDARTVEEIDRHIKEANAQPTQAAIEKWVQVDERQVWVLNPAWLATHGLTAEDALQPAPDNGYTLPNGERTDDGFGITAIGLRHFGDSTPPQWRVAAAEVAHYVSALAWSEGYKHAKDNQPTQAAVQVPEGRAYSASQYLEDTLATGSVNEQIVARTALRLLAAAPEAPAQGCRESCQRHEDGDGQLCGDKCSRAEAPAQASQPTQGDVPNEREAFEAWASERYLCGEYSFKRCPDGYAHTVGHRAMPMTNASVQMLWEAWRDSRAALASQQAGQAGEREELLHYKRVYSEISAILACQGEVPPPSATDEITVQRLKELIESRDTYVASCEAKADRIDRLGEMVERLSAALSAAPARAERERLPAKPMDIDDARPFDMELQSFACGWRSAEAHHGITKKEGER